MDHSPSVLGDRRVIGSGLTSVTTEPVAASVSRISLSCPHMVEDMSSRQADRVRGVVLLQSSVSSVHLAHG